MLLHPPGKPVYTLAAKKLYQKGIGKADAKKGIQRSGPSGSMSTNGKGMNTSYSGVYEAAADAMADEDDEDDEEEEDDPELVVSYYAYLISRIT